MYFASKVESTFSFCAASANRRHGDITDEEPTRIEQPVAVARAVLLARLITQLRFAQQFSRQGAFAAGDDPQVGREEGNVDECCCGSGDGRRSHEEAQWQSRQNFYEGGFDGGESLAGQGEGIVGYWRWIREDGRRGD